ncbi:MAG: tRNA uridine-5-carboxymethylaminomethyl(34) synthesis GTPase MnmE [Candidatus Omnitrophica bacterium]|nr:tRNA uridine-5-carboxymethylaminomethyl(34) synthesis GTPase MnmE [Candidatus Omnitrophota bacterium]MCM8791054.1 tRNA uridine-5-carboxymethylaminomethyl(34) synthesis GTPase MnmE [Candidatus Omnitrophota bacterium]
MRKVGLDDTIVAMSTPVGEGGIGIVRLSGPKSLQIADRIFVSKDGGKPSSYKTYTVHYGHVAEISSKLPKSARRLPVKIIDEVILTVMRAPRSYTKEDVVEINCHGGLQAVKKVLELAVKNGARIAEPGEFTKRAFLNGRIDLAQAEAVLDVIRAKTEGSLKLAISQLEGDLSRTVDAIRDKVIDIASHVEASIDFPEEELETAQRATLAASTADVIKKLRSLISTYDHGAILREGILAIICGKTNVGKSSLMNLLLKRDRVIVSPIPGTTRDAVEEMINLKGIPIRLVDTAGIVETKDSLEREGIARSKRYLALADMVILVLDNSTELDKADLSIVDLVKNKRKVVVINKCDLARKIDIKKVRRLFEGEKVVELSVSSKNNIEALEKTISELVWKNGFSQGESALVSNARHKESLDKALANMLSVKKAIDEEVSPELVAIDLKEAIFNLGLITGKSVADDILDRIFEKFCIGK